mmetsp:Transcript_16363/g.15700  ORF Transcript_16363/g.15700 Transcript_16363/m.15700 type:complete len:115 (-) Transcript_16363:770-1114(-)
MVDKEIRGDDAISAEQKNILLATLNSKVNKYEEPNIFNESKRQKYLPTNYRGGNEENRNRVINNNTSLRIFNVNQEVSTDFHPFTDVNIEGNKPMPSMISYKAENNGILKKNRS